MFAHRSRPAALSAALLALACTAVPPLVEQQAPASHGEALPPPGEPAPAKGEPAAPKVDPASRSAPPPALPAALAPAERSLADERTRSAESPVERPGERQPRGDAPRAPALPRPDASPRPEPQPPAATARDGAERLALAHGFVQIPNPIPRGTRFARLRLGMTKQDAESLLGLPDHALHYANEGARIPFYASDDSSRWETFYRGQGRLLFSGAWLTGEVRLIRIEYDPQEDGRRER